ncbi:4445_t:CDS:2 [Ambispora gerdemannii]|uniref:4445_t:CDS:1 n=1 Tax=Ambispora gerdemannii TaxID=144530 RepID=A0A9N9AHC7_9GLOM|nr:4445_t:CDS:2 [Ambispora gerdemannii]
MTEDELLFKDWNFHILKLSQSKSENFKERIIAQALKSPARISRYVPEDMPKPVVSLEWLEEWLLLK